MTIVGKIKAIARRMRGSVRRVQIERELAHRQRECIERLDSLDIADARARTLAFVESMRIHEPPYGRYGYSPSQRTPVLYASTYAAMVRHLYGDLSSLTDSDKEQWIEYISTHQDDDGLFKDPLVENDLAVTEDWWGWRHLTWHVTMALTVLRGIVRKPFAFLEPFLNVDFLVSWLKSRDWGNNPDFVSNEVQNIGALLQYACDFHNDERAGRAVVCLLDWLEETQDPRTGFWGEPYNTPALMSRGVQTGYHLWLLFFYDKRPVRYVERIIDSALATQNRLGGFGVPLNSSACEDIDSTLGFVEAIRVLGG